MKFMKVDPENMPASTNLLIYRSELIHDVVFYTPSVHEDERGEIFTFWSKKWGLPCDLVEGKVSISHYGTLRGFHADQETYKLITCLHGKFQLALVDARRESKTYGCSATYILSEDNNFCVLVPPRVFNAHLCLSPKCIFHYMWSEPYKGPEFQETLRFDDPDLRIRWQISSGLILSQRDKNGKRFKDINI